MNNLKKKLKKQGGFTLIEMLIVVAIIAILIAVSIPLVGSALERTREATDAANERAFKAELVVCYLAGTTDGQMLNADGSNKFTAGTTYNYNAADGKLEPSTTTPTAYGQGTANAGQDDVGRAGGYLKGSVSADGVVSIEWSNDSGTNKTLTSTKLISTGTTSSAAP